MDFGQFNFIEELIMIVEVWDKQVKSFKLDGLRSLAFMKLTIRW